MAASKKRRVEECISERFLDTEYNLSENLSKLCFLPSVSYVYNPLKYAREPHCNYIRKYCRSTKTVLFVGMNPGPFGMAQNGVPFGDPKYVKEWLEVEGNVEKPPKEHPKRPILGLDSTRSEVSGTRFWGFLEKHSVTPENFFASCFVHNYCPLVFMTVTGKNITPNNIPANQRKELFKFCDQALIDAVDLLGVEFVVCIGKFVEGRCKILFKEHEVKICSLMHPSPANPRANASWEKIALEQLERCGVMTYIRVKH
ncbi:single-strand selective monofunctional uracil DNA glycosylase-like [Actinia tenebrosa]|uniref:Single-strand selective monofunctional uracil DNA glycosylase-like n=1 Tax=Actinia tenebrosa TaxID=6105 RepID=A0A6P8IQE0_ACTTE|nr:single-strand selective monofunctional uracil DNA glycosylase-like [Actinia tenebrosa]